MPHDIDLLPWRHDVPPMTTIVLRAGPGHCPMVATWTESKANPGGGFYTLLVPDGWGRPYTKGYVSRGDVVSTGWEWLGVQG